MEMATRQIARILNDDHKREEQVHPLVGWLEEWLRGWDEGEQNLGNLQSSRRGAGGGEVSQSPKKAGSFPMG